MHASAGAPAHTRDLQVAHALVQWRQHAILLARVNHACRQAGREAGGRTGGQAGRQAKKGEGGVIEAQSAPLGISGAPCRKATRGRNATPSPDSYSSCTKVSCWRSTAMAALQADRQVGRACKTGQVSRDIAKQAGRQAGGQPHTLLRPIMAIPISLTGSPVGLDGLEAVWGLNLTINDEPAGGAGSGQGTAG